MFRNIRMFDEVSDESLGREETYVCQACHNYQLLN